MEGHCSDFNRTAPTRPAISGVTHLDQIGYTIVVKFGMAVAEERAGLRIIADGPVLVVRMPIIIHHDGVAPGLSPIRRAADEHIDFFCVPTGEEAQEGDDPHPMFGVKSRGCVTDTRIDTRWC